jgi:hypothetical protein
MRLYVFIKLTLSFLMGMSAGSRKAEEAAGFAPSAPSSGLSVDIAASAGSFGALEGTSNVEAVGTISDFFSSTIGSATVADGSASGWLIFQDHASRQETFEKGERGKILNQRRFEISREEALQRKLRKLELFRTSNEKQLTAMAAKI